MKIPLFINCRDRLTCLQQQLDWFERSGTVDIIIVDNASTYPPLLEFYRHVKHRVVRLQQNLGNGGVWRSGIINEYNPQFFGVTDDDVIPREDCPRDAIPHFVEALTKHPDWRTVGFGLEIWDLPQHYRGYSEVLKIERQQWWRPLGDPHSPDPGFFEAAIDGGMCPVYRDGQQYILTGALPQIPIHAVPWAWVRMQGKMVRSNAPYLARHWMWYVDSNHLPEDVEYYLSHIDLTAGACWSVNHTVALT